MMEEYIMIFLVSLLPWVELRGAIPLGIIIYGLNPIPVFFVSVLANILVVPPLFLGLNLFYDKFKNTRLIKRTVARVRKNAGPKVKKYGPLGLTLFVAIPLPVTGAWTGTLVAWLLGMEKKKAFTAIALGVIIAGILVTLISLFAVELIYWITL
jgi:uncharacterized membrane protein